MCVCIVCVCVSAISTSHFYCDKSSSCYWETFAQCANDSGRVITQHYVIIILGNTFFHRISSELLVTFFMTELPKVMNELTQ